MRYPTRRAACAATVLAMLTLASSGLAQYREYYARGRVLDEQKKPLPDVEITLVDASTSRSFHMKTDQKGEFKFAGLPHAKYEVTFARDGYVTTRDTWKFDVVQERMQKVEVPDVVLVSQAHAQHKEQLKEADAGVKKASEKIRGEDFDGAVAAARPGAGEEPDRRQRPLLPGARPRREAEVPRGRRAPRPVSRSSSPPSRARGSSSASATPSSARPRRRSRPTTRTCSSSRPARPRSTTQACSSSTPNRVDEARARFEQGIALKPTDPDLLDMAARCYIHEGQLARALEYLEKARAAAPDPSRAALLDDLIVKVKAQIK